MLRYAFIIMLAAMGPVAAQPVTDYLGVPGPIVLGDTSYELAWTSQPTAELTKHEYVPAGQTVEHYNQMLMLDFMPAGAAPLELAQGMLQMLEERKASDPVVNSELILNDATGEVILDFVLSAPDDNGDIIVEWNVYRYASVENAVGEPGSLLFAVSHRDYGDDDAKAFLADLGSLRAEQIGLVAGATLPKL